MGSKILSVVVQQPLTTLFGIAALTFMMAMYGLERRGPRFVLAFAGGCLLSSGYGFLAGTWPFGVVEAIWAVIALRRYRGIQAGRQADVRSMAAGAAAGRDE